MLKACSFTSHENVVKDIVVPVVLERQSNICQQHFKVLRLLIPVYSFALCDITGCNYQKIQLICCCTDIV